MWANFTPLAPDFFAKSNAALNPTPYRPKCERICPLFEVASLLELKTTPRNVRISVGDIPTPVSGRVEGTVLKQCTKQQGRNVWYKPVTLTVNLWLSFTSFRDLVAFTHNWGFACARRKLPVSNKLNSRMHHKERISQIRTQIDFFRRNDRHSNTSGFKRENRVDSIQGVVVQLSHCLVQAFSWVAKTSYFKMIAQKFLWVRLHGVYWHDRVLGIRVSHALLFCQCDRAGLLLTKIKMPM